MKLNSIMLLSFISMSVMAIPSSSNKPLEKQNEQPTAQQQHVNMHSDFEHRINEYYGMSNIYFDVKEVMTITLDEKNMGKTMWYNMHQMVLDDGFIALNIPGMKSNNVDEHIIVFAKQLDHHSEFRVMIYDPTEGPTVLYSVYGVIKNKMIH